ncbi:hypothetical protein D3C78_1497270 [compost metagenome]
MDEVDQGSALRTERAAVDGVIGVAFDVHDAGARVLGAVAQTVHQQTAGDRTVGTGVARFGHARKFVLTDLSHGRARGYPQQCQAGACQGCTRHLEELAAIHVDHEALLSW